LSLAEIHSPARADARRVAVIKQLISHFFNTMQSRGMSSRI
jgi:hypothetical protein